MMPDHLLRYAAPTMHHRPAARVDSQVSHFACSHSLHYQRCLHRWVETTYILKRASFARDVAPSGLRSNGFGIEHSGSSCGVRDEILVAPHDEIPRSHS